jgi:hypothetical protein
VKSVAETQSAAVTSEAAKALCEQAESVAALGSGAISVWE